MIWHWVEAIAAAVVLLGGWSAVSRRSPAGRRLAFAVVCAVGANVSVLGYRTAWQTGCWVVAGVVWLLAFWSATRRRRRRAVAAAAAAEQWRTWQESKHQNGWH